MGQQGAVLDLRSGICMAGGSDCGQHHLSAGPGGTCRSVSQWHQGEVGKMLARDRVLVC